MYDDALLARIRDYIAQNRASFTLDALRRKLIEDGVPPDAIDIAIAQLYPDPYRGPAAAAEAKPSTGWTIGRVLLTMLGVTLVNLAIAAVGMFASFQLENGVPFLVVCGTLLAAEITGAIYFARRNGAVSIGLVLAIVASPIAAIAILFGICIIAITTYNA